MKDLREVDFNKMQDDLKKEVEAIGYEYIANRPLSTHPDDWYLRIVLGRNARGYATWVYNADLGGLHEGHYDMSSGEGQHDFLVRL